MTEQMIKYEDIRVGDRIRVEWMVGDVLRTYTGTVVKIDVSGGLRTKEGCYIGSSHINKNGKSTITLLDRPKPSLPNEVGSVIHVSECRGFECNTLAMLDHYGRWRTPIPVAGYSFHCSSVITAWEPREVVEVQK